MSYCFGWVCIGLGAALAALVWPFRRGVLGVALNSSAAIAGAVGAASLGVTLGLSRDDPRCLPVAVAGAFALLGLVHVSWTRPRPRPRPHG
ncbi:MAG TPA: hypothetical protein VIF09_11095 [Polyangiaceae bacterium]|jgi:hypothetical protein